jgi:uncharacterized membrane protein YfcA
MDWLYAFSGLVVGLVVGMTGVGGGSLMTPLLVMGFGVAPVTAVGTDLLYAGLTKAGGSVARHRLGSVDWRVAGLLALGSVPAALGTAAALARAKNHDIYVGSLLTTALGVALVMSAVALVFKEQLQRFAVGRTSMAPAWQARHATLLTVMVGALLGLLVTLTSVGAGALGAVALLLLYPHLPTNHVAGTDIVHAVPLTLVAGASHAVAGTVNYAMLGSLLVGSLPGILLGSLLSQRLPDHLLRRGLALVLFVVGVKLVL